jgi:hypothetical protein
MTAKITSEAAQLLKQVMLRRSVARLSSGLSEGNFIMKMNKLYMGVAAAVMGLSSHAMAALNFTNGAFTGGVDIGGSITVPAFTNEWEWSTGDALVLDTESVTMTNGYTTMTIPATANWPLLVGRTKAGTAGHGGSSGLNPQIAFADATDTAVIPAWGTTGNAGKGTITLPVTDANGATLGSMKMTVKFGGIRATIYRGATYLESTSTYSAGVGLFGAVAQPSAPAGALTPGSTAAAWNALLGAYSASDMLAQLNTAASSSFATWVHDEQAQAYAFDDPSSYYSGSYGLGIASGDDITVTFTNAVTTTTAWKSALKATITYL